MRRRDFTALIGWSAIAWPRFARAEQRDRVRRIGVLMGLPQSDPGAEAEVAAFRNELSELGWSEGRNIAIEFRWPAGEPERVQALAKELVGLGPAVLVARSTPTTIALKRETSEIPIVFVNVAEPIESGLVQSFVRPGGNVTGFTNFEASIGGKWLQLLKQIDPRIARAAVIYNPQTAPFAGSFLRSVEAAAPLLAVRIVDTPVRNDSEIEAALRAFARESGGGLIAIPDSFTLQHRPLIIAFAASARMPALYTSVAWTASGGLMAYAVDTRDLLRRAAGYVDRILKGANPAELPVQHATKFQLSINLRTAQALGLTIPEPFLQSVDEVIE